MYGACRSTQCCLAVWSRWVVSSTRLSGFRALKKTPEAPYTTKVNYRGPTSRGTILTLLRRLGRTLVSRANRAKAGVANGGVAKAQGRPVEVRGKGEGRLGQGRRRKGRPGEVRQGQRSASPRSADFISAATPMVGLAKGGVTKCTQVLLVEVRQG